MPGLTAAELAGADVNLCDEDKCTALMLACQDGRELCVRTLVMAGAALEFVQDQGATALMLPTPRGGGMHRTGSPQPRPTH